MIIMSRNNTCTKLVNRKYFYILLVGIFFVLEVLNALRSISIGLKINQLQEERSRLMKENEALSSTLINFSSLSILESGADELGFVKPVHIFYIENDEFIARAK